MHHGAYMIGVRALRFNLHARSFRVVGLGVQYERKPPVMRFSMALATRFIRATTVAVLFRHNSPIVK